MLNQRRANEIRLDLNGYAPSDDLLSWPISKTEEEHIARLYQDYIPLPEEFNGLQRIVRLQQSGQTQVVLVEVLFCPDVVTQILGIGNCQVFDRQIESYAASANVLYWPTTLLDLVPVEGWGNLNHLNSTGADIFSQWLGDNVGAAVNAGDLMPLGGG